MSKNWDDFLKNQIVYISLWIYLNFLFFQWLFCCPPQNFEARFGFLFILGGFGVTFALFDLFSMSEICSRACRFKILRSMWPHFLQRSCCSVGFHTWCRGVRFCSSSISYPKPHMTATNLLFATHFWIAFLTSLTFVSVCINRVPYFGSGVSFDRCIKSGQIRTIVDSWNAVIRGLVVPLFFGF